MYSTGIASATSPIDLFDWRAKRAGGRITIYAKDAAGAEVRVPHVDEITAGSPPLAVDKNGRRFALRSSHAGVSA